MQITLWVNCDGSTYIATPKADVEAHRRVRLGHITSDEDNFCVAFTIPALSKYNKAGFATRQEAICYEQGIINRHLAEHLPELFKNGENSNHEEDV